MSSHWIIDERIDATAICESSNWHLATCIDGISAEGVSRSDAEAFANFVFCDHASIRGGDDPEDWVTQPQYERLSYGRLSAKSSR